MYDRSGVRICQRTQQITRKLRERGRRERTARQFRRQGLAGRVIHDVVQQSALVSGMRVMNGQDVRMVEPGEEPRFTLEALDAAGGRELRAQHLDRHRAIEPGVARAKDMAHPTGAEFGLDEIARRERHGGTEL